MSEGRQTTEGQQMNEKSEVAEKTLEAVFLTGFMGSGKSTVGRRLARFLSLPFTDTDVRIEKQQGKSISDIFAQDGEEAFRRLETETLRDIGKEELCQVVSTGGGLPMREENRRIMKEAGLVVFLRVRPETVYGRLQGDTTRPLLQRSDPQAEIRRLLAERNPLYEAGADLIVDVDGRTPQELAEQIGAACLAAEREGRTRSSACGTQS